MSTKFTPGPWKMETVKINGGKGSCHRVGNFPTGQDWHPETYACVYADGYRIGIDDSLPIAIELRANAHLIAAAPDMYEVLATLENDDGSIPEFVWEMRNAALAKARGES